MQNAEGFAPAKAGDGVEMRGAIAAADVQEERKIVWLLCLLAAIHVLVFCMAFPFFNNVDEPMHFDLVVKYSHGHPPRKLERISAESAGYLAMFSSWAYTEIPARFPGDRMPSPPWTKPPQIMRQQLDANIAGWQSLDNYEASEAPLYYGLAGGWWRVGKLLGLKNGHLLYWLRFLNVAQMVALIWLAWFAARLVFPENIFVRFAVPSLVAFMPQTAFYSINNDMTSSLCFGAAFICLLKWLYGGKASALWAGATGLALAATELTKATNLPLLGVTVIAVAVMLCREVNQRRAASSASRAGAGSARCLPEIGAFIACMALPVLAWTIWCKVNYGDWTGSKIKTEYLGWTVKKFADWWHHPIFTPPGFWTFLCGQLGSFWQGEFVWHAQPMALPLSKSIYCVLSLILPAAILPTLKRRFAGGGALQRFGLWFSLACCAALLAFFGFASVVYDFHNCTYPSRKHPYFVSGRLLLGVLIPFMLCFAYGLNQALNRLGNPAKFRVLGALILLMFASE
ncbi:MAG: DUF2142 domain-containing protein, partial [Limisphaerales bacterium]